MAFSFIDQIKAKFASSSTKVEPVQPVAISTTVQADNSAEVKFGFTSQGQAQYNPNQTYAEFAADQARQAGISLQANYTPQYIVNGQTFVVDPSETFAQLNARYSVTPQTSVAVSIPDPERRAGELG